MEMPIEIDTYSFETKAAAWSLSIYMFTGLFITIISVVVWGCPKILLYIGFFIFFLLPLLLMGQIKKIYTKKTVVKLTSDHISIELFAGKTQMSKKKYEFRFNDIKYYKIGESSSDDSSVLWLYFKNGSNVTYTFLQQDTGEQNKNVGLNFSNSIRDYNKSNSEEDKINIIPNLFASKKGKYYIVGLTVVLTIAIIIQIIFKPRTIPFSLLIGIVLYIRIIAQRKKDTEQYKKMNK